MTAQLSAPFRYDHVGSFLRPKALKEAREKFQNNEITYDELKKVEDEAIIQLINKQKEIGILSITDGEFRRSWWHFDFLGELEGMEFYEKDHGIKFHNVETTKRGIRVVGKIDFGNHPFVDHFKFIRDNAGDATVKLTIPSPNMLHARADKNTEIYPDEKDLIEDTIKAYQKAIQAFYDAGCRYLQLDDTSWASLFSEETRAKLVEEGKDPQEYMQTLQYVINETVKNKPSDMTITMHICRGNYKSTFHSSGGYNFAAEVIFGGLNVDGLFLEFDDERSGGFEPLKYVNRPDLKIVLGLVTSKFGELENKEEIIARIQEAAKYAPLNQLCLSPQCGFSSTEEGNILEDENQWQKLTLIKEIADEVWG